MTLAALRAPQSIYAEATHETVAPIGKPTHVFFCTWSRQTTEDENCVVNGAMLRHAIQATIVPGALKHAALVTGLKHYLGGFEQYATVELDTPFTEDQPRVPGPNFYYTQEDVLLTAAAEHGSPGQSRARTRSSAMRRATR
jgi:hypothetical protein